MVYIQEVYTLLVTPLLPLYFSLFVCLCICLWRTQKVGLEFYIDVHAHSTMMNGFMYGNVFEEEERVQRQAVFPRLLCQNAPDFSFVSSSHQSYQGKLYNYCRAQSFPWSGHINPNPTHLTDVPQEYSPHNSRC